MYLSDVLDHTAICTQNLVYSEKVLSRSHSNYLAQISIERVCLDTCDLRLYAHANHPLPDVGANTKVFGILFKLTAFGTILVPVSVPHYTRACLLTNFGCLDEYRDWIVGSQRPSSRDVIASWSGHRV